MRTAKCVVAIAALVVAGAVSRVEAVCGDGVRDGSEQCDGADLGGATCASLSGGFVQGGTLTCNPDCTFNKTGCQQAFIQTLVPATGGSAKNRCQLEWTIVGTQTSGPPMKRVCTDGDRCDEDPAFGSCTMRLQLCLDVPDPRVSGCAATKIFTLDVLAPKSNPDAVQAVMNAGSDLARGSNISATQGTDNLTFSAPITDFACGQSTIKVPLKGTPGHYRPGKVKLRACSADNSGKMRAVGQLTLVCMP